MMLDDTTVAAEQASRRHWWLVAIAAGLLVGPLDLWGQVVAPYPWAHLFNSPAVWASAASVFGRWARHHVVAAVGAAILLVVAVEAYYVADVVVRDADRGNLTSPTAVVWIGAGVVAGVVFGVAGAWSTETVGLRTVLGRAALPAVLAAEAFHNLLRILREPADGRPDDLGQFVVLLVALAIASLALLLRGVSRATAAQIVATTVIAAVAAGSAAHFVI